MPGQPITQVLGLGRDCVPQDERIAWDDGDHYTDWPVVCGVAGPDVLGYWRSCGDTQSLDFLG
jgi:hypothetical protein